MSLRSVADGNFVVIDRTSGAQTIIAEVDYSSAALTLYEGAVYMVQSSPYQVESLDWAGRKAFVTKTNADYFTDAIDYTKLKVPGRFDGSKAGQGTCHHGEVHVVRRVSGYKKIRFYSHENIGYGPVTLPDQELQTSALWWQLEQSTLERTFRSRQDALDGFLGAAYVLDTVAQVDAMADTRDLRKAVGSGDAAFFATQDQRGRAVWRDSEGLPHDPERVTAFNPTAYLYDNYPGGVGLSEPLYTRAATLVDHARQLVCACGCKVGCPAWVGPSLASDEEAGRSAKRWPLPFWISSHEQRR